MSYTNGAGSGAGATPQYTPEEIAYWASMGYVLDPSAAGVAPAAPVDPAAAAYAASYNPQQQAYGASTYPSIPSSSSTYGAGSYHNQGRPYGSGSRGGYNISEYEDLNKIFADPKKIQEEAAAAAARAEEEAALAKAKAAATVVRKAAGQTWEDSTLLEFDESKKKENRKTVSGRSTQIRAGAPIVFVLEFFTACCALIQNEN